MPEFTLEFNHKTGKYLICPKDKGSVVDGLKAYLGKGYSAKALADIITRVCDLPANVDWDQVRQPSQPAPIRYADAVFNVDENMFASDRGKLVAELQAEAERQGQKEKLKERYENNHKAAKAKKA